MSAKVLLIGSLCFAVFHIPVRADALVYIVSADITGNGTFGTVNLDTGSYQQIGASEPDGYFGLAPGPNGSLVAGTYTANLDSINPVTGTPKLVGPTGLGPCLFPSPSCGPNSYGTLGGLGGAIYATDFASNLYTVNPNTGAATLLNAHSGLPAIPFIPGSLNPDGTINFWDEAIWGAGGKLYATVDALVFDLDALQVVDVLVAPKLYQIDPATGVATVLGPTDLGISGVADVSGVSYAFNDLTGQITSLNVASGETTFVSNFDPGAGVIQGAAPITPEPDSIVLTAFGIFGLIAWRTRTRRRHERRLIRRRLEETSASKFLVLVSFAALTSVAPTIRAAEVDSLTLTSNGTNTDFILTGVFGANAPTTGYSAPNAPYTLSFSLPTSPTSFQAINAGGRIFAINTIATLNGLTFANSNATFFNASLDGGLAVCLNAICGPTQPVNAINFEVVALQLYTGVPPTPIFIAGNGGVDPSQSYLVYAAPEPSSAVLTGSILCFLFTWGMRKRKQP